MFRPSQGWADLVVKVHYARLDPLGYWCNSEPEEAHKIITWKSFLAKSIEQVVIPLHCKRLLRKCEKPKF